MSNPLLPAAGTPILNPDGTPNRTWYRYFNDLTNAHNATAAAVTTVTKTVAELQAAAPDTVGTVTEIDTAGGLTGGPITGSGTVALAEIGGLTLLGNPAATEESPEQLPLGAYLQFVNGALAVVDLPVWAPLTNGDVPHGNLIGYPDGQWKGPTPMISPLLSAPAI